MGILKPQTPVFLYFWLNPSLLTVNSIRAALSTTNQARKLKKSGQKNSWNQINQFDENFFDQIPFFAISKLVKNQFLNCENV